MRGERQGSEAAESAARSVSSARDSARDRVARSILDHGPSSAADLAERLGITQAAVRRHLDALIADGLVAGREQRVYGHRGRGRPAKVFSLTHSGRDAFHQAYDQLAAEALRFLADSVGGGSQGEAALAAFARARLARDAERYRGALGGCDDAAAKAKALAGALSDDGYAATVRSAPAGEQICQHHCPVVHVAEQFPQFCEAETEVFSQLLGTHVQRLATIAHGDGVCTTFVPAGPADRAEARRTGAAGAAAAGAAGPETVGTDPAADDAHLSGRNPE